jgi:hypothetical protein
VTEGTFQEAASTAEASSGNVFRYDPLAKQYIFNLSTKPMAPGTHLLRIDLDDGQQHDVTISLKAK